MGLKSDGWIRKMCLEHKMISPFEEKQIRTGISYGLSSYGYDIRVGDEFRVFAPENARRPMVDPKQFDPEAFVDYRGDVCVIPPTSFVLARSLEYFRMPRHVTGIAIGKSTYHRCGILCHITPLEAGWEGVLTIGISNGTPLPAKIYAFEGIAQVLFFEGDEPCMTSYAERSGKYQAQQGITPPKI